MPLDTSNPEALAQEIEMAIAFRQLHTLKSMEIVRRFIGNWYRTDVIGEDEPENLISNYVTFALSEVAFSTPEAIVEADRPVGHGEIATFMEIGFEGWMRYSRLGVIQTDLIRDMLTGYGVGKIGLEGRDCYNESGTPVKGGTLIPFVSRVPPDRFFIDPRSETCDAEDARLMGDEYFRDYDSIIADEQFDQEAVSQLEKWNTEGDDSEEYSSERAVQKGTSGPRKLIRLADVWVRETGELITLAMSSRTDCQSVILRKVKYYGPPDGPYHVFGTNRVPGDPYPISNLQFCMEQYEELQAHASSASDAAETYKRFVAVEASNTDAQNALMVVENGGVVGIRGIAGSFQQCEVGGPNSEQLQYVGICRDRFDRVLGLGDAQRGRVANATATESRIAQDNVDSRMEWLHKKAVEHTSALLKKVGFYLFYEETVRFPVSRYDWKNDVMIEGEFQGGVDESQRDASWIDFNLSIRCDSMRREDKAAKLATSLQLLQIVPQAAQIMMQLPMVNVRWILNEIGKAMNYRNLADIVINQAAMVQFGQAAIQQDAFNVGNPGQLPGGMNPLLQQFLQSRGGAISDLPAFFPSRNNGEQVTIGEMMKSGRRNMTGIPGQAMNSVATSTGVLGLQPNEVEQ